MKLYGVRLLDIDADYLERVLIGKMPASFVPPTPGNYLAVICSRHIRRLRLRAEHTQVIDIKAGGGDSHSGQTRDD